MSPIRIIMRMLEPDCFIRYRICAVTRIFLSRKIWCIRIGCCSSIEFYSICEVGVYHCIVQWSSAFWCNFMTNFIQISLQILLVCFRHSLYETSSLVLYQALHPKYLQQFTRFISTLFMCSLIFDRFWLQCVLRGWNTLYTVLSKLTLSLLAKTINIVVTSCDLLFHIVCSNLCRRYISLYKW